MLSTSTAETGQKQKCTEGRSEVFLESNVHRPSLVNSISIRLNWMHLTRDYPPDEFRVEGRAFRDTLKKLTRTFFADVKEQTGFHCYRGFLWHAFSYGYQSALERHDAVYAYENCGDTELYVHDEQLDMLWLCPRSVVNSDTHPCNDTYIFPQSYNWLYITTHENAHGIGPYFVRVSSGRSECG